eukprot:2232763-Prymnesium_polylepis.1
MTCRTKGTSLQGDSHVTGDIGRFAWSTWSWRAPRYVASLPQARLAEKGYWYCRPSASRQATS